MTTLCKRIEANTVTFQKINKYTKASHGLRVCANAVPDSFVLHLSIFFRSHVYSVIGRFRQFVSCCQNFNAEDTVRVTSTISTNMLECDFWEMYRDDERRTYKSLGRSKILSWSVIFGKCVRGKESCRNLWR